MYGDPRHIRNKVVPVRLNHFNTEKLEVVAMKHKRQPATFAHDLLAAVLECDEKREQVIALLNL